MGFFKGETESEDNMDDDPVEKMILSDKANN